MTSSVGVAAVSMLDNRLDCPSKCPPLTCRAQNMATTVGGETLEMQEDVDMVMGQFFDFERAAQPAVSVIRLHTHPVAET